MLDLIFKLQIEGWHRWIDAPKEYKYLSYRHRHIFHIHVRLPVVGDNREFEFIQLSADVRRYLRDVYVNEVEGIGCDFDGMSCEQIAKSVYELLEDYKIMPKDRKGSVGVFEDGVNGAVYSP